jgi:hypothetical protein
LEVKVSKTKDGVLLSGSLPPELASSPSLELFPLRDGAYLLTTKGFVDGRRSAPLASVSSLLSEPEKQVVRKLLAIRFEKRAPSEVGKALLPEEKETLANLMKKKIVHVFQGERYGKEGVYSVSDFAFNAVREGQPAALPPQGAAILPISSYAHLEKFGWMVLEGEQEAKAFAAAYPEKVKSGEVSGVRAFDRKFYFVARQFYQEWEKKVQLALSKSEKSAEEIASETGLAPEGCRCLLFHLCENGEAMEKHRGNFSRA